MTGPKTTAHEGRSKEWQRASAWLKGHGRAKRLGRNFVSPPSPDELDPDTLDELADVAAAAATAAGTTAELEAARAFADWGKRRKRRAQTLKDRPEDVRRATMGSAGGGASTGARQFAEHELKALKDAILEHCERAYRKSWGKDWMPEKAWPNLLKSSGARILRDAFRALDAAHPNHVEAEKRAREALASL